ncbi:hypothetical protein XBO1_1300046 [Xenorhabdus bovienii str. oregonense]|uniref:Uncharacterized protein n=1 Tax=Xenorhabdus bovienii str. oregonense TaxID=1398202 RepID=A0A077NQR9_XENBV|nr:hypothetical protein XBO1_1300046 [Xenorhabdus bovienii str. oregonense]
MFAIKLRIEINYSGNFCFLFTVCYRPWVLSQHLNNDVSVS